MKSSLWPWVMRALWLSVPFTSGAVFADALDSTSRPVEPTALIGLWTAWGAGMAMTLIPHTLTLTAFRIIAPAALAGTIWAVIDAGASSLGVAGLSVTAAAAVISLSPQMGTWFVNGTSYGDERRFLLRPPGPLLLGPIPLFWLVIVAGTVAGPLLLAAKRWAVGGIVLAVGIPAAVVAIRSMHALSLRWLVFVPAGVVVHDHLSVTDPVLFKRGGIRSLGPALAETTAHDLSQGALGLALELRARKPVELAYFESPAANPRTEELDAIVISVSRPGEVLAEARSRGIAVG
ncbi:MAG: hypothetical protein ACC660_05485 [Acidimicrobiales bacterium]